MTIGSTITSLKTLTEAVFMGVNAGRLSKTYNDINNIPILRIKDVFDGTLAEVDRLERVDFPSTPQTARQLLQSQDILVSARGTIMKCAMVPPSHTGAVASANFIVIRVKKDSPLRRELLCAYLRHPAVQADVTSRVTNTAQSALTIREVEELPIPIPPKSIQSDLARLITIADQQYRCALESARLRKEEAMDIVAEYMDVQHVS